MIRPVSIVQTKVPVNFFFVFVLKLYKTCASEKTLLEIVQRTCDRVKGQFLNCSTHVLVKRLFLKYSIQSAKIYLAFSPSWPTAVAIVSAVSITVSTRGF